MRVVFAGINRTCVELLTEQPEAVSNGLRFRGLRQRAFFWWGWIFHRNLHLWVTIYSNFIDFTLVVCNFNDYPFKRGTSQSYPNRLQDDYAVACCIVSTNTFEFIMQSWRYSIYVLPESSLLDHAYARMVFYCQQAISERALWKVHSIMTTEFMKSYCRTDLSWTHCQASTSSQSFILSFLAASGIMYIILTEVVIEDIEIDLFEFLADCIILI